MNMEEFVKAVENQAKVGDRQLYVKASPRSGQVFITLINLPKSSGSSGAEAMNNRFMATVEGFGDQSKADFGKGSGDEPPSGKVKASTSVPFYTKDHKSINMRGKSGTPESIAKCVADFVTKLANDNEPNFTHSKKAEMTPQVIANELRHILAYLNGSEGEPSRRVLANWMGNIALKMGSSLESLKAVKSGRPLEREVRDQLQKMAFLDSDGRLTAKGEGVLKAKKKASAGDIWSEVRIMIAYLEGSEGQPDKDVVADWISRTASAIL